jgi:hypothetical protein
MKYNSLRYEKRCMVNTALLQRLDCARPRHLDRGLTNCRQIFVIELAAIGKRILRRAAMEYMRATHFRARSRSSGNHVTAKSDSAALP